MKISGYYHLTKTPNLDLETEVMDSVYNFLMGILRNSPAGEYIMTYKHIFESLDKKWSESVERVPLRGHRTQRMYIQSLGTNCRLSKFIQKRFNYYFAENSFTPLAFTKDKFRDVVRMQIAFWLAKYGFVYKFELQAAAVNVLFNYFKLADYTPNGYQWCVKGSDISDVIYGIDNDDDEFLRPYYSQLEKVPCLPQKPSKFKKKKPSCADDIIKGFPGGTRADLVRYAANTWSVVERTAWRWLDRFEIKDEDLAGDEKSRIVNEIQKKNMELRNLQNRLNELIGWKI